MTIARLLLLPALASLIACSPQLERDGNLGAPAAQDYPKLRPLSLLLSGVDAPSQAQSAETELNARASALRAKANALRAQGQ